NPAHAPYGKAAEEALRKAGVWDAVRPKLVYGENIRHTLQFLQTGAAEAGIVATSVANVPEIDWVPIDPRLHAPLNQATAVGRRRARGVRRLDRSRDQVGAGGLRDRGPAAGAGRPHARALRVVGLLERNAAAGLAVRSGRGCAGVLPGARRVRDHTDGGGEHPGPDANPAAGDLRPRAGRADGRGERVRAHRRRRRRGAALRPEPAGAASLLAVVSVEIVKRYPGFTLDVSWRAEKSVVGLF